MCVGLPSSSVWFISLSFTLCHPILPGLPERSLPRPEGRALFRSLSIAPPISRGDLLRSVDLVHAVFPLRVGLPAVLPLGSHYQNVLCYKE